ncbi:MAG TPA: HAD family hydrolase [Candidatus Limnocylindria bacterium]|jgi:HAD superfamily hydrolase (TIGR01549 family)
MTDAGSWVVFDVGETLVDETRVWSTWADVVGVPRLTFMAVLGAVIARGGAHQEVFAEFGLDHWEQHRDELEAAYGGFREDDLYPDVRPAMAALRAAGHWLAIFGNQPAHRSGELRALRLPVEVIAMSSEMGVAKPDPAYFAAILDRLGRPSPGAVVHVGDRVDNDVLPAAAGGLRSVWIRRGPWGRIQGLPDGFRPDLVIDSLAELPARLPSILGAV